MIPKDALALIEEIKKSKHLSTWEKNFIASISIQAKQGRYLQSVQSTKLQEVYRLSQSGRGRVSRHYA